MFAHPRLRSLVCAALAFPTIAGCGREAIAPAESRENLAPVTHIVDPRPSSVFVQLLEQPVTIRWTSSDPDGRVREYRYRLFSSSNPDFPGRDFIAFFQDRPDSLLSFYAPDFTGWDRLPASPLSRLASVTYPTLVRNQKYLFVVVTIDDRGAYDTHLSMDGNALQFVAQLPYTATMTFVGPFGSVRGGDGVVVVPAGEPVTIHWFATPVPHVAVEGYLSSVDQAATSGTYSPADTIATILPPTNGDYRLLFVEAQFSDGYRNLGFLPISFTGDSPTLLDRASR